MVSGKRSFRLMCPLFLSGLLSLVPAPAAAHTHPFHKNLARASVVTAGGRFPWLRNSLGFLQDGSTKPDFERGLKVWENKKHKHDAGLVADNYKNALARFGEHAKARDLDTAWSQGSRILAKAFHYYADQSEPMFGERVSRFRRIMRASPRDVADRTIARALADPRDPKFKSAVEHYVLQFRARGFSPKNAGEVGVVLQNIESALAKRVVPHLGKPPHPDPEGARREIETAYRMYVAELVALQNITIELFDSEARKLIPGEEPPAALPGMDWVGRWSYWVTNSNGKVFGRGTAWFQISRVGNRLVLNTHKDKDPKANPELIHIDDHSLEIHFNDEQLNYMKVSRNSPNTIEGLHWSPQNPKQVYRDRPGKVEGHKR